MDSYRWEGYRVSHDIGRWFYVTAPTDSVTVLNGHVIKDAILEIEGIRDVHYSVNEAGVQRLVFELEPEMSIGDIPRQVIEVVIAAQPSVG